LEKRWIIQKPEHRDSVNDDINLSRIAHDILARRGIHGRQAVDAFLYGVDPIRPDPFKLAGMDAAVERIQRALHEQEYIVVYGDYDADGVTASALLVSAFRQLGANVDAFIPDRFIDGYGLHSGTIDRIHAAGCTLLVTVDCGIRGIEQVDHARSLGIDVIVTDHHQPGATLPDAIAIIDPKQPGCTYGYTGLAGVGLAYKLVEALDAGTANEYLDFVAVGTVADLAPMVGENRNLVRAGIKQIEGGGRPGLDALLERVGAMDVPVTSSTIGYRIGPRINAAGRLKHAMLAYELLMAEDAETAAEMADSLNAINQERRTITEDIVQQALSMAEDSEDVPAFVFAFDEQFHEGVVGLAASRLAEQYYRPAAVGQVNDDHIRASVRSIPEFNVILALDACKDLLLRHGGHSAAAGFTVALENRDALVKKLRTLAEQQLAGQVLRPSIDVDCEVSFRELDDELLDFLEQLEPFGPGNPVPVLAVHHVEVLEKRRVGKDGKHLKLLFRENGLHRGGIAFGMGERALTLSRWVDVAFHLERNVFRGVTEQQLNVIDMKNAGT